MTKKLNEILLSKFKFSIAGMPISSIKYDNILNEQISFRSGLFEVLNISIHKNEDYVEVYNPETPRSFAGINRKKEHIHFRDKNYYSYFSKYFNEYKQKNKKRDKNDRRNRKNKNKKR